MIHLEEPLAYSPAGLGMAVYEKVQEMTRGKATKAATFLTALTGLELSGRELPDSAWCTLVLISLSELAQHAPRKILVIRDWKSLYHNIARCSGEKSAKKLVETLAWARSLRPNVLFEPTHSALVNYSPLTPPADIKI